MTQLQRPITLMTYKSLALETLSVPIIFIGRPDRGWFGRVQWCRPICLAGFHLFCICDQYQSKSGCSSDTAQVVITRTNNNPVITITVISDQTNCKVPDGGMFALAEVEADTTSSRFNFEWYRSEELLTGTPLSLTPNVTGLQTGSYSVYVEDKISACSATKDQDINADINIPVVVPNIAVQNTSCAVGNGSANASVAGTGVIWYEDFEDNAISQTVDTAFTSWSRTTNASGGHSSVQNINGSNVFQVERNGSMRYTDWRSGTIDISSVTNVKFSMEVSSENIPDWSFNNTYIRIQYSIDGGVWNTVNTFYYDVNQPHPDC